MAVLRLVVVRLIMVTGGESHMNVAIGSSPSSGELGRLDEGRRKEGQMPRRADSRSNRRFDFQELEGIRRALERDPFSER
jgi:hypothetical protein